MTLARTCLGLLAALLFLPSLASAQAVSAADGPMVARDADTLVDVMRPDDPDVTDTVLIFTNLGNQGGRVLCRAFDKHGRNVGRAWLAVPKLGLRYAIASDISHDVDFVGSVQCFVAADVVGSAVLLAAGELSDLPVVNGDERAPTPRRIAFPVVATY